jgi:gentisate 1,2-dioxygenase
MSVVYYVVKGKGAIVADGKEHSWEANDIISLTPWTPHELLGDGGEDSVLFSLNDRPLLKSVGLYREEPSQ